MTLEQAVERLKKKGLLAELLPSKRGVVGGTGTTIQDGVSRYNEPFTIGLLAEDVYLVKFIHEYGDDVQCHGLDSAVDFVTATYLHLKLVPPTPTSDCWERDAQGLVDMGARSIDVNTVKGLLADLKQHRLALARIEGRIEGRMQMNETAGELHPDGITRATAKVRVGAYKVALSDLQSVVADLKKGTL